MIKGTPSKETTSTLFDRLATDQNFREQMLGDPVSALKEHGIEIDAEDVPSVRKLPSKDALAAVKSQLLDDPAGRVGLFVFLLK